MKIKVFVEYKLVPEKHSLFTTYLPRLAEWLAVHGAEYIQFYIGADQPHLVVEEYWVRDLAHYHQIKEAWLTGKEQWMDDFFQCIVDARNGVHIWAFKEIKDG